MQRSLRWFDMLSINVYYMGLTVLSQTMTPLVIPLLVQQFVGEAQQGTFYGTARLWSLMVALLVQALMGLLSDRNTSRFGRRRPFILVGTIALLINITAIGFTAGLEGSTGFWVLFILLLLLSVASNTAHGAVQGLIPDLVPEEQRGRYSGVKALLEVPLPLIFVSFTIGPMISQGSLWGALFLTMGVLVLVMLVAMLSPEQRLATKPEAMDWQPFLRLLGMTGLFTLLILGMGALINTLGRLLEGQGAGPLMLLLMTVLGLAAMAVTISVGVWFSVQIGAGQAIHKSPAFTWWVINRLSYLVGSTNLASFAVFFLQGRLGLAREQAAAPASRLILFVGVFILLLAVPSGWLADRYGRRPLVALSGLVAALGTLVLILAPNLPAIYLGGVLVGAATGLFYSANWALGTDLVPKDQAGRFLGISNLAGAGAGAVGAYIGGPIADFFTRTSPETPGLGYVVLFSIYGCLFLFSLLALTQVKNF